MRVSLWAVFTDLHDTFAERNLSVAKGESMVIHFSSIDMRTIQLKKEVVTSSILLLLKVPVSGRVIHLVYLEWGVKNKPCLLIGFSLILCAPIHHGVQLLLGINQGENPFTLIDREIYYWYT